MDELSLRHRSCPSLSWGRGGVGLWVGAILGTVPLNKAQKKMKILGIFTFEVAGVE